MDMAVCDNASYDATFNLKIKLYTLMITLNFYVSFESKIRLYKNDASINQPRPCINSACHFI